MHLVTASGFLSHIAKLLSPTSQLLLLRTFFSVALTFWVSRGRPTIDFTNFYQRTSNAVASHGDRKSPAVDSSNTPAASKMNEGICANPWLSILRAAMFHPNEHLPKIQRTLAHYATTFGAVDPHMVGAKESELRGTALLDDNLFVRVAILTMEKVGLPRMDGGQGDFDFDGLWPRQ